MLDFTKASPDKFEVVFVANATAGIKLVAEAFRDDDEGFWYGYHKDAHTSLIGVRELATRGQRCFWSDEEVETWISQDMEVDEGHEHFLRLFSYPGQSNMSGRRLLEPWPRKIREATGEEKRNVYTLFDAASLATTCPLDLSDASTTPDFTIISFYKIFGYPDLGALIVRKDSAAPLLQRKYFSGGTVEVVASGKEQWHIKKQESLSQQLEDGTLPIHSIIALEHALSTHQRLFGAMDRISSHVSCLAKELFDGLAALRHGNEREVCVFYSGPCLTKGSSLQGPIVAFNLQDSTGAWVAHGEVGRLASIKGIHLRTGGLCNPAGVASSLALAPWELQRNFSSGHRCGSEDDIISGKPTGMIRVSLGAMSTLKDVKMFLAFIKEFFVERSIRTPLDPGLSNTLHTDFYIEALNVYPIKSCGAWSVPHGMPWDINAEGLAWDREWCLVHRGSHEALSQKRFPKMALLRPSFDFERGQLVVGFCGPIPPNTPGRIHVPLSWDPSVFIESSSAPRSYRVCHEDFRPQVYNSATIAAFVTNIIGTACTLARYISAGASVRHAKAHLQIHQQIAQGPPLIPRPISLSNESPILVISRSSLDQLNEIIKSNPNGGKAAHASVFRANIIIEERPAAGWTIAQNITHPYIEDHWSSLSFTIEPSDPCNSPADNVSATDVPIGAELDLLGSCRRCQMVCIDQNTAEKDQEPFLTLAKTRRLNGKVWFGVHAALRSKHRKGRMMVGMKAVGTSGSISDTCL